MTASTYIHCTITIILLQPLHLLRTAVESIILVRTKFKRPDWQTHCSLFYRTVTTRGSSTVIAQGFYKTGPVPASTETSVLCVRHGYNSAKTTVLPLHQICYSTVTVTTTAATTATATTTTIITLPLPRLLLIPLTLIATLYNLLCPTQSSHIFVLAGQQRRGDNLQPSHRLARPGPTSLLPCCNPAIRHGSSRLTQSTPESDKCLIYHTPIPICRQSICKNVK